MSSRPSQSIPLSPAPDARPPRPRARRRWRDVACAAAGALACLIALALAPADASAFGLDDVARRAEELAKQPYRDIKGRVPDWLVGISYDQWRDIRFRPDKSLWRGKSPFEVQLFHAGLFYDRTIDVDVVDGDTVKPLGFSPDLFDYGKNDFAGRVPQNLGFAGFRVHYPIKNPSYADEVIVFLGASYFRSLGRDQVFGLSARGLAIDTAEASGEEFPYFREFWLVKPGRDAKSLTIYALLDSPTVAGAYRFVIEPGVETKVDVEVRLFVRDPKKKLGLAPLTSMFFHGENRLQPMVDFRPEVHDSDGLLVENGTGEWIWRPLENPKSLHVTSFQVENPKGFGLIQRDRDYNHYQDLEARSELRPSAWVAPQGDWGKGRVELVEIPTMSDIHDNVGAYFVPAVPPEPGKPLAYAYSLLWYGDSSALPPGGRVVATRRDYGTVEDAHRFVIDFEGKELAATPAEQALRGVVTVSGGDAVAQILDQQVVKNPVNGQWRLTFQLRPKTSKPIDLRAFLDRGGDTLTETWSYTLVP